MAGISPSPVTGARCFYVGEEGGRFGAGGGKGATARQETGRDVEKINCMQRVESSDMFFYTTRDCKLYMEIFYLVSECLKKRVRVDKANLLVIYAVSYSKVHRTHPKHAHR